MRTIKFRGKRCDNGEWVYGYYARLRNEFKEWHCIMTEKDASENYIKDCNGYYMLYTPVNHNTVGQFTGLLDKNGKEIYEGDILRYPAEDKFDEENFVSFEVFWHDNDCADNHVGWQIDRRHFHGCICGTRDISTFLPRYTKKMVIIGNIHDNPELMKGGEE